MTHISGGYAHSATPTRLIGIAGSRNIASQTKMRCQMTYFLVWDTSYGALAGDAKLQLWEGGEPATPDCHSLGHLTGHQAVWPTQVPVPTARS